MGAMKSLLMDVAEAIEAKDWDKALELSQPFAEDEAQGDVLLEAVRMLSDWAK